MQTTNRVKNPRKQRKRFFNAPAHIRHKSMAAPLSKELAAQRGVKTLPVRKGDTVHIQRGDNKGFEGKISRIDLKTFRIFIEGLTREKVDGTNIFLPVHPSKVMIKNLNLDDKWRKNIIGRKEAPKPKAEKKQPAKAPAKKPEAKPAKVEEVKPEVVAPVEEKAVPKVEEQPVAEETVSKAKVAPAKKPTAKKPAAKVAPVKKEAKPKAAKAEAKKAAKASAKPKASKKVEGGQ
jgi:large subunit ribosomal protein L24